MNLTSLHYSKAFLVFIFLIGSSMSFSQTKVVMLGSGNPNPDPGHQGPGVAIVVNEQAYLIDFGTGIVRQAAALTPKYGGSINALNAKELNIAFLTHLHADHTIGLPDLIFTPWIMGRDKPLKIIGPEGVMHMTSKVLEAYQEDIKYRLYGLEPANNQGWRVEAQEIKNEGIVYEDSLVTVEAFDVSHGSWPQCFGFKFTTPDRIVVISGDTSPSENLIKWAMGADVLVHEVYYYEGWTKKTDFWKEYHQSNHTSSLELAEIARKVQPKLLVCYHTLYWGGDDQDILSEIKSKYSGEVVIGQDGMIY